MDQNVCQILHVVSRIDDVEVSALHILDMVASVRFGPRFLIACFTLLLLHSVASWRGMLVPLLP